MSAGPPLSPQVFSILATLIEERLGLFFNADYRELLAEKLGPRALERGFDSMLDYYYFLRYDPEATAELQAMADVLTVNETYFFRELQQLRVLVSELLPPRVRSGSKLRIWCAACSTGEEPITVAGMLDERGILPHVELVASDLSARALQVAKKGHYSQRSMRAIEKLPSWLRLEGGSHVTDERLRGAIEWRRINLLDDEAIARLGTFDVIICRNVLIYFRDETVQTVVKRLHQSLSRGGVLLVGASESLMRLGTAFGCEEHGGAFFYRKGEP